MQSGSFRESSRQRELIGKLEQAFEPCMLSNQNSKTLPHDRVVSATLHREVPSGKLSRPGYARGERDLSPAGYAAKDAERQAVSRRVLQETRRSTPPRPPPSGQSSFSLAEPSRTLTPADPHRPFH